MKFYRYRGINSALLMQCFDRCSALNMQTYAHVHKEGRANFDIIIGCHVRCFLITIGKFYGITLKGLLFSGSPNNNKTQPVLSTRK